MKEQFAASAARKQPRREKSPSELGEEVLALMLSENAKERAAATPAPEKTKAAVGTPKAAQYGGFTQEAAGNAKAAQYDGGFTEKTAAGNQKTAPYGGAGAGRIAAQYEPSLYSLPAAGESAAPQALAAAGLDENAIRGAQWNNVFPSAMQNINQRIQKTNEITAPIRATSEWQALAAAQDLAAAGLDANAQQGLAYGDSLFRLGQKIEEITAPIRATPEWQAQAAAQNLAFAGLNGNMLRAAGTSKQLWDDTHIAEGKSAPLYWLEKGLSGAAMGVEGAYNNFIDWGRAGVNADLMQQMQQAQQFAWLGEPYQRSADLIASSAQTIQEALPEAAENLRSHRAAEYGRQVEDEYDAGGYIKLIGDLIFTGGQMLPTMGINALTGGTGGLPYIFSSAAGNAAAEARAGGANEDLSFAYGLASGALEASTEKMFDGFPGMKGGWMDDLLADTAETNVGRALLKAIKDSAGEGIEEIISGEVQPFLAKMWNGDERGFWQTLAESAPEALYEGFLGSVTSFGMGAPGNYANLQNARIVDAAIDTMNRGGILSDAQLAEANAAIKALTGRWGENSRWSGNAVQQWEGAKNNYFGSLFPQANNLFRGTKDIDTSDLIMLPMVDDSRTQVNSATDSDSSVIANPEESVALTNESLYDTVNSGGRITDIESPEAKAFAEMYYEEIRHFSTDTVKIAENLGVNEADIRKIKEYLFENPSLYEEDTGEWRRFDTDCAIAQSWQRLMLGKDIKPHDRTLIYHELLEMEIKTKDPTLPHWKAHEMATEIYDYPKEVKEYYGSLKSD